MVALSCFLDATRDDDDGDGAANPPSDDDDDDTFSPIDSVKIPDPTQFESLAMRPYDLDGEKGEEVLYWVQKEVDGELITRFEILDLEGGLVFQSDPVSLGQGGGAQYTVAELDGVPPGEIIVTYQSFETTDKDTEVTSWACGVAGAELCADLYHPADQECSGLDRTAIRYESGRRA